MISVFWSTMVDLWSPDAAKRVFGFVAAGGSAGALAGPAFNAFFVEEIGATAVIYVACAFLIAAVLMSGLTRRLRANVDTSKAVDASVAVGGRAIEDLARFVRSPYLLGIAGLIVMTQIFGAFMYNEQAKYVEAAWSSLTERAAIFARIDLASNALSLLFQTLLVGWLTARGGRARNARDDLGADRCFIRDTRVFPVRHAVARDASDPAWLRLRPLQAGARNVVHRSFAADQIQEQESHRHGAPSRLGQPG